ncbi:PREDICTED: probable inactive tRNA-specific adenosine deaminase-like protein 3 [Polistes dominula]|uniref:Probable inactive tRNA-specific adenosine deaminase-like protein 3 n=1 Tax=Polistes dominula TaxID=743375 RepID=A0ABM1IY97_POLDO|nr:PREDICTED: probable inactive tRNA-specific adenosine deaminase-like protein 3 [Polistes dominula]
MSNTTARSNKECKMELVRRTWTPKPILDPEITKDLPTIDAYVGILKEKKNISAAIKSISTILPYFDHLKRCSANKILLAPVKSFDLNDDNVSNQNRLKSFLKDNKFDLSILEDDFRVIKVPETSAKSKTQAARASKIWPLRFHPDPFLEAVIDGSIFNEDQLEGIEKYMNVAITAAKLEAIGNDNCNGSAVIVDPENDGRILAIAASKIDQHPMWHASMLAIDLVAKLHGGGAWKLYSNEDIIEVREAKKNDNNFEKRMKMIKRKYEEHAPLCYPKTLSSNVKIPAVESFNAKWKLQGRRNNGTTKANINVNLNSSEKSGPYLCTGCWVFLLMEPCPMCAMALLHSRVGKIFYGVSNEKTGVLGSNGILHAVPGLNHRYQVWSGILEETCKEVSKEIQRKNVDESLVQI